ncbi:hypothetical protein H0X06_06430 [Candidatus Dependentiae bacterium]|nr:hypothetical protein [Candidatus Dependentiae bacterium]
MLWNTITGYHRITIEEHRGPVNAVVFSPDGLTILTGSTDGTACTHDLKQEGDCNGILEGHKGAINSVAFSSDGLTILTASTDGTARIWDVSSEKNLPLYQKPTLHLFEKPLDLSLKLYITIYQLITKIID